MTKTQALELFNLRTNRAWSWYELANRYGISESEVRRIHRAVKNGTFTGTENDATNDDALETWMDAIYASGEQMGLEMWANYRDAIAS